MVSFSRRRMLAAIAAAGGVSRLAPFLPNAVYAAGSTPKRILTVFSPMGHLENSFWPTGTGSNFTLGETMTALEPYKSKLLYLDGLALYGPQWYFRNDDNEHAAGGNMVFTGATKKGYANGPSIEQAVATFQYAKAKTPYRALALGLTTGAPNEHSGVFYSKAQTPVTPQNSPVAVFNALFQNFTPPMGGGGGGGAPAPNPNADRYKKQQQSVLNLVKDDLKRIRALAGRDDQMKVDDHLDGISSLENRLGTGGAPPSPSMTNTGEIAPPGSVAEGCAKLAKPVTDSLEKIAHAQMDLIASAFACDLTRSISLQLGMCDGSVDAIPNVNQHNSVHAVGERRGQPEDLEDVKKYDRWYGARWAYLLGRLNSIKEGNGTVLDNTLIVFGSDTTTLQNLELGPHQHHRFPMWLAGGGNFAFKTGQVIKLPSPSKSPERKEDVAQWVVHHRLLTSICQAFGMPNETFGDLDPGRGPVTQLQRV